MVMSDTKATLGAIEKERSRSPIINATAREIAQDRAMAVHEPLLEFAHVAGKRNKWADALSRLAEPRAGAAVPWPLRGAKQRRLPRRDWRWWRDWEAPGAQRDDSAS
jgi:hypothetical protein